VLVDKEAIAPVTSFERAIPRENLTGRRSIGDHPTQQGTLHSRDWPVE
jgi:hypothetical protein